MSATYRIGIDLGTTHTSLAYVRTDDDKTPSEVFSIPQLVSPSAIEARPLLPSFMYCAHESEGPLSLPWDEGRRFAVGEHARARAVDAPSRVISSAKSWLCHGGVDRRGALLPKGAASDIEPISPVETAFRYLEHLAEAWASRYPDAPLGDQEVVLTVPASFDPAARELTVEAALAAGLDNLTLLEEPQAALYAWLETMGDAWRRELSVGDVVLVVDIGGGTTDFSAMMVSEEQGNLSLSRIAVGDHILLGGDNMDLALAYVAKRKFEESGKELDAFQLDGLTHSARSAKELLLGDDARATAPIAVASRGSRLVGSTLRTELSREEVLATLVDGFFPVVGPGERPKARPRAGLTQLGLPYAYDPGVTRHLAAFLARQGGAGDASASGSMLCPTRILWNGGVLKAKPIRERILSTLNSWLRAAGAPEVRELSAVDLDLSVAKGAAAFGRVRAGRGVRIRGGTAKAYYVGIEGVAPSVPGVEPPLTAVCVAPFGMEEGSSAALPPLEVGLVVGEPVRFRFFSSTTRRGDVVGTTLEKLPPQDFQEIDPIEASMPVASRSPGDVVPVRLHASVTEIGTLELEAIPIRPLTEDERWKLELSVRSEDSA